MGDGIIEHEFGRLKYLVKDIVISKKERRSLKESGVLREPYGSGLSCSSVINIIKKLRKNND
jgi:hypothetical protein